MRADMFKVIVERPRRGSRHAAAVKLRKDKDPHKQIGLKRHAWEQARSLKFLNENLAPLVRFLQRRVGRRWDDVFSEICASLDTGSAVKMHVRQHLGDFVLIGITYGRHGELMHDGHVLHPDKVFRAWRAFYVDPDDGLLKNRAWFWRDHGRKAAAAKRQMRWEALR